MKIRELLVPGAWEVTPDQFPDDRGTFCELYRRAELSHTIGHPLQLAQLNCSTSRRGVLRGVHFADVPPGQAKYVFCPAGAVLDVVVDLRTGSPTFGRWDSVVLDESSRRAVYLAEGLGHAFLAMAERSTVTYLCSQAYRPGHEHGVHPLDPDLALPWPADLEPVLSPKDAAAPSLAAAAAAAGLLPSYEVCADLYARLGSDPA